MQKALGAGGGGGGYSGGGGATYGGGGGGGSFDAGVDQVLAAGVRIGDGEVMITELGSGVPAVSEPSSLAMVGTGLAGLAGLAAIRRRSKT
jgi:hypothetical protein